MSFFLMQKLCSSLEKNRQNELKISNNFFGHQDVPPKANLPDHRCVNL